MLGPLRDTRPSPLGSLAQAEIVIELVADGGELDGPIRAMRF